ncbi:hypothetical protein, partial [Bradyrhizobium sp. Leo170]|uniref:hypothetical protein n=1 Tax=Bradyrhizobium sp. Leo170 TaxID=1571199 RepID=UPI001A910FB5
ATGTRLSLRPLLIERVKRDAKLGRNVPRECRENADAYLLSNSIVMPREGGGGDGFTIEVQRLI